MISSIHKGFHFELKTVSSLPLYWLVLLTQLFLVVFQNSRLHNIWVLRKEVLNTPFYILVNQSISTMIFIKVRC